MKNLLTAFAALLVGTATLFAQQPPQGGRPVAPKPLTPEEKTAQMAQDYDLTAEQEAAVLELNKQYDGKLEFRFEGFGQGNGERKDPRNMSDAERQQFFEQMQERMAQMQEKQAQIEKDQKAYDKRAQNFGESGDDSCAANTDKLMEIELQTETEHQDNDADFTPGFNRYGVYNREEIRHVRAYKEARQDIPQNKRLLKTTEQYGNNAGCKQHNSEVSD